MLIRCFVSNLSVPKIVSNFEGIKNLSSNGVQFIASKGQHICIHIVMERVFMCSTIIHYYTTERMNLL